MESNSLRRNVLTKLILATLTFIIFIPDSYSYDSGESLLHDCNLAMQVLEYERDINKLSNDEKLSSSTCMTWSNATYEAFDFHREIFGVNSICFPDIQSNADRIKGLVNYMHVHPDQLTRPGLIIAVLAWSEKYPCKNS